MIDLPAILLNLGSTVVIVAGLSWVAKKAVEAWLARDLENHKRNLERDSQRELERLRLDLRLQEVRQSRLLDEQATVIAGVYARLERVHAALVNLVTPTQHAEWDIKVLRGNAERAFNDFNKYFFERGIWFDEDTCNAINKLQTELTQLVDQLHHNTDAEGMPADRALWMEAFNRVKKDIPPARGLLDKRFRQLLGGVPTMDRDSKCHVVTWNFACRGSGGGTCARMLV